MEEIDAERRLQILRGDSPGPLPIDDGPTSESVPGRCATDLKRKRRRIAGENDTDRDLRRAREDATAEAERLEMINEKTKELPITDRKGHISLFPDASCPREKNAEVEAEATKKRREFEDQYTMRFSNAAGTKQGLEAPWYSTARTDLAAAEVTPGKDVGEKEGLGRREREQKRLNSGDPLAAMKKGVSQLRRAEKARKDWMAERERDLKEVEQMAKDNRKRRRDGEEDEDSVEDFSLDNGDKGGHHKLRRRHSRSREQHHNRHRHRHRR
jgi:hypothetical protein